MLGRTLFYVVVSALFAAAYYFAPSGNFYLFNIVWASCLAISLLVVSRVLTEEKSYRYEIGRLLVVVFAANTFKLLIYVLMDECFFDELDLNIHVFLAVLLMTVFVSVGVYCISRPIFIKKKVIEGVGSVI